MFQIPVYTQPVQHVRPPPSPHVSSRYDYYDGYDDEDNHLEDRRMKDTIRRATDKKLLEPNWELNMSVVDQINQTNFGAWSSSKFIKERLGNRDPHVVYLALVLLETAMKNCGKLHNQIGTSSFLSRLVKLASKKINYYEQKKKEREGKPVKVPKDKSSSKSTKEKAKEEMKEKVEEKVLKLLHIWSVLSPTDSIVTGAEPHRFQYYYVKLLEKGVEFPEYDSSDVLPIQEAASNYVKPAVTKVIPAGQILTLADGSSAAIRIPMSSVWPSNSLQFSTKLSAADLEKLTTSSDMLIDCVHQDVDILSNPLVQELHPVITKGKQQVEQLLTTGNIRDEGELATLLSVNDLLTRALEAHHEAEVKAFSKLGLPPPAEFEEEGGTGRRPIVMYDSSEDEECELLLFGDEDDAEVERLKAQALRTPPTSSSSSKNNRGTTGVKTGGVGGIVEGIERVGLPGGEWEVDDYGTDKCFPTIVEPSHVRDAKKQIKKEKKEKEKANGKKNEEEGDSEEDVPLTNKRRMKK